MIVYYNIFVGECFVPTGQFANTARELEDDTRHRRLQTCMRNTHVMLTAKLYQEYTRYTHFTHATLNSHTLHSLDTRMRETHHNL